MKSKCCEKCGMTKDQVGNASFCAEGMYHTFPEGGEKVRLIRGLNGILENATKMNNGPIFQSPSTNSVQSKEQGEKKWCVKCNAEFTHNRIEGKPICEVCEQEEPQQRGWIKILEVTYDLILKAPHRTLALTLLEDFVKTVESNAKAEGAREVVEELDKHLPIKAPITHRKGVYKPGFYDGCKHVNGAVRKIMYGILDSLRKRYE